MSADELTKWIDTLTAPLWLFARQWSATPEDVVQEAFLKLIRQPKAPENPRAWLFQTVRNAALDQLKTERRRKQRESRVALPERYFEPNPSSELSSVEIQQALQRLSMEEREVIIAHLWGNLSFEEIGQILGCVASTAHRRYQQGLQRLKTIWEKA